MGIWNFNGKLDMIEETFKPIVGFDGYEVSNYGRIKSVERELIRLSKLGLPYVYRKKSSILKAKSDKDGYLLVNLWSEKKCYTLKIHRLVAMAFLDNPNNYPIINHKDCDTANNFVGNLEWCSYSYNNTYHGAAHKRALKNGKPLIAYKDGNEVGRFISSYEASKYLNCSSGVIRSCLRKSAGKDIKGYNQAKGYTFQYL